MASIKSDNGLEGMRNNFQATAAHLMPYDPVAEKRSGGQKRGSAQISSVMDPSPATTWTEFRRPLQVQSHLEMPGILVQLGHTQRT